jgi:hypothetical protein
MSEHALAVALAPQQVKDLQELKEYFERHRSNSDYLNRRRSNQEDQEEEEEKPEEHLEVTLIKNRFDSATKGVFFLTSNGERIVYSEEGKFRQYPAQ